MVAIGMSVVHVTASSVCPHSLLFFVFLFFLSASRFVDPLVHWSFSFVSSMTHELLDHATIQIAIHQLIALTQQTTHLTTSARDKQTRVRWTGAMDARHWSHARIDPCECARSLTSELIALVTALANKLRASSMPMPDTQQQRDSETTETDTNNPPHRAGVIVVRRFSPGSRSSFYSRGQKKDQGRVDMRTQRQLAAPFRCAALHAWRL